MPTLPGPFCPICGRRPAQTTAPFCSVRCADIDLGRWFNEDYRIGVPLPEGVATEDDNLTG